MVIQIIFVLLSSSLVAESFHTHSLVDGTSCTCTSMHEAHTRTARTHTHTYMDRNSQNNNEYRTGRAQEAQTDVDTISAYGIRYTSTYSWLAPAHSGQRLENNMYYAHTNTQSISHGTRHTHTHIRSTKCTEKQHRTSCWSTKNSLTYFN